MPASRPATFRNTAPLLFSRSILVRAFLAKDLLDKWESTCSQPLPDRIVCNAVLERVPHAFMVGVHPAGIIRGQQREVYQLC